MPQKRDRVDKSLSEATRKTLKNKFLDETDLPACGSYTATFARLASHFFLLFIKNSTRLFGKKLATIRKLKLKKLKSGM